MSGRGCTVRSNVSWVMKTPFPLTEWRTLLKTLHSRNFVVIVVIFCPFIQNYLMIIGFPERVLFECLLEKAREFLFTHHFTNWISIMLLILTVSLSAASSSYFDKIHKTVDVLTIDLSCKKHRFSSKRKTLQMLFCESYFLMLIVTVSASFVEYSFRKQDSNSVVDGNLNPCPFLVKECFVK